MTTIVKVKICGITRLEDALTALEAGVDYVGFILYPPSPRAIAPDKLAGLVRQLRQRMELFSRPEPPLLVGVFVNEPSAYMVQVLTDCHLDLAQLSGDEPLAQVNDPTSELFGRVYKAVRLKAKDSIEDISGYYAKDVPGNYVPRPHLLVDTPHESLYGGTGQTGNWSTAAQLAARYPGVMLAGGLTPSNVAEAVRQVRPFAVDVAGGVESAPGQKDHALVRAFITQAKSISL